MKRRTLLKLAGGAGLAMASTAQVACRKPAPSQGTASKTIKLGYVSPQTGPLAAFGEPDNFVIGKVRDALKGGLTIGGQSYAVEIIVKDSQSNPNRAAQVTKDLIVQDKVDLMLSAATPDTVNPVATQCEIEEVPCISTECPWQPWFIGRQANPAGGPPSWKPFNWTYHYFWGLEDIIAVFTNMWNQLPTNKIVGGMLPNDQDGNAFGDPEHGFPAELKKQGYTFISPGRHENHADNFSAQIAAFKKEKVEIVTGVMLPPDFTTFWKQALQQGFKPKALAIGKPLVFPVAVEALGKDGHNLATEVSWSPSHPFKSSLTGESSKQLGDAYESATGKGWTQPIGLVHSLFEVAIDVLKRSTQIGDKKATVAAIAATNLATVVGKVQWNGAGVPPFAAKNVAKLPCVGGQWRRKDSGKYELVIVDNKTFPAIPVASKMEPLS